MLKSSLLTRKFRHILAAIILMQALPFGSAVAKDYSLALYAGRMTDEKWFEAISPDADFVDATIVVTAASWTFARYWDGNLSLELEGQVGKYFGDQDNWEFNIPIIGFRWHRWPWDEYLATSFAWGIGPSYATSVPEVEVENEGESQQWLIYWYGEFTFGPPNSHWELLLRLHHRSDGFGLVGDEGGSNTVCGGVRFRF